MAFKAGKGILYFIVDWAIIVQGVFLKKTFSAVITKGRVAFVAHCPELGVTSQGKTKKGALANLNEAVELYLEDKDVQEMLSKTNIRKATIASIKVTA